MISILAVAQGRALLASTAGLLRKTNVPVVEATSTTALALFHRCRFDVVVLCHTLSLADSYILTKAARKQKAVGVLQVLAAALAKPVYDAIAVNTVIQGDDLSLLKRVGEMLHRARFRQPEYLTIYTGPSTPESIKTGCTFATFSSASRVPSMKYAPR